MKKKQTRNLLAPKCGASIRDASTYIVTTARRLAKGLSRCVGTAVLAGSMVTTAHAVLNVEVTESGKIFLSADGAGTNDAAGVAIQVDKPNAAATVRSAFLTCAGTSTIADGQIQLDGTPINWDRSVINGFFRNVFADVTAVVKPKVDAAAPGLVDFQQTESNRFSTDGCGLYVVFDDAAQTTDNTVFILFGGQTTTGDNFSIGLAEPLDAGDTAEMGIAISFGAQDQSGLGGSNLCGTQSAMFSLIDVNGTRLTSCAGNVDDGVGPLANGMLITVGGIGDDPANPTDPFQQAADGALPRIVEDELYDLTALLGPADVLVQVDTLNPSNDDNIFAGHFTISTPAIIGEGVVLSPSSDSNPVGTQHTLTARVQDDNGNPVITSVTIEVISGPNAGVSGTGVTDANGEFSLTYTGLGGPGVDQIQASFNDSQGSPQVSNVATKEWIGNDDISIDIDIKPGSFPNSINMKRETGVIPVAILGSEEFDVTAVDVSTLTFGKTGTEQVPAHDLTNMRVYGDHLQDVNEDGYMDLVSHYRIDGTGIMSGDTEACLSGKTGDDINFMGCDSVLTRH